ncbi:MAG: TIGR03118 family protein, partial [Acidobacteriia bacterium]|nr:TIGR03118 family protein [Terriglobia bacterium]
MFRKMLVLIVAALPPLAFSQVPTANAYVQHNLVSDVPGLADVTDPNLVDPWGMSASSASPIWVSNHDKGVATLYNGSGAIVALVVTVPPAAGGAPPSKPTGQVNNSTTAFVLANGKPASFIFVTEDGTLSAWNAGAASTVMADNSASGAVYKGLAIGASSTLGPLLYAANINSGNIDVFDGKFTPAKVAGSFANPNIPSGFAPFNVWNLGGKLYVTYAKQSADKKNDVAGSGNGFVSVFDTDGNLLKHLVSNGPLNSPWGVAIAPSTFSKFAGALLVGNFGNGNINAFDLTTGSLLGTLQDTKGNPIQIEGLWALLVGNGKTGGDTNMLYFAAGISNGDTKVHGLFGSLAPPATVINAFNAASGASGAIAPGEALMLSGISIGPSPLASGKIPLSGSVDTSL